jgi:hypothetical protein
VHQLKSQSLQRLKARQLEQGAGHLNRSDSNGGGGTAPLLTMEALEEGSRD